jgi:hypothetical protein
VKPGADGPEAAVPHLLQKLVPGVRGAPQELQNAISHLVGGFRLTREYTAEWEKRNTGPEGLSCLARNAALKDRSSTVLAGLF